MSGGEHAADLQTAISQSWMNPQKYSMFVGQMKTKVRHLIIKIIKIHNCLKCNINFIIYLEKDLYKTFN